MDANIMGRQQNFFRSTPTIAIHQYARYPLIIKAKHIVYIVVVGYVKGRYP